MVQMQSKALISAKLINEAIKLFLFYSSILPSGASNTQLLDETQISLASQQNIKTFNPKTDIHREEIVCSQKWC